MDQETPLPRSENMEFFNHNDTKPTQKRCIQEIANQENRKTTCISQWSDFNSEKVENGLNYTTTITKKSIVFHVDDGFNYLRSGIDSTGTSVFLR